MKPFTRTAFARLLISFMLLLCIGCTMDTEENVVRHEDVVRLSPVLTGFPEIAGDSVSDVWHALHDPHSLRRIHAETPTLGFRGEAYWLAASLINIAPQPQQRWVVAGHPHLDRVDLHVVDSDGRVLQHIVNGDGLALDNRPVRSNELVFPVSIPGGEPVHLLFRIESTGAIEFPVRLLDARALQKREQNNLLFSGLFFGAIIAIGLYNFLLYLAIRDTSYLFYVLYLVGLVLFLVDRNGFASLYIWPDAPELTDPLRAFAAFVAEGFALLFCVTFMQVGESRPRLALAMRATGIVLLALAVASFWLPVQASLLMCTFAVLVVIAFNLPVALLRINDGFRPAFYFVLAFLPLGLLVPLFVLSSFNLIHNHWAIDHAVEIGSAMEAWLLSFALAHRFTLLKAENERIQRDANQQLEKRVRERTEELNHALNARSEFLAVMSHEIRTPLNGILGTVDMLQDTPLTPEQQHKVHVIEQSGNSLLQLINDILDYTRIEAGKLPIQPERLNLERLVHDSVALFEHPARVNGNTLEIRIHENVGEFCEGDSVRIRQVLVNLVSNAVKFTEGGTVTVDVSRDVANEDYVLVEVLDTGIGVSDSQKTQLFQLFQQGDASLRRRYGGTGLGLAICRQLVELMGGEIGVRDNPSGRGTCFWFRLPLPRATSGGPDEGDGRTVPPMQPKRLLIVDDNHVNLLVAQGLARKLGHSVEVAESGPEAISVLLNDRETFDLILMDCEMPDMDGMQTAREIIRLQSMGRIAEVPVVALTAHAVPDKIRQCHEAGMVSHIAKPINSEKLNTELRAILNPGRPGFTGGGDAATGSQ